jgi:uridine kinase
MNRSKVVAVSGVSGAGKTTIVEQLADQFNSPYLLFDDYTDKHTYPQDMKAWLNKGADVCLIKTPRFVSALNSLVKQNNYRFIFIEEPFGRERQSMASLIDYVVLLDPSLELCLARIIKRHTERNGSIDTISKYLDKYQDHLRDIYKLTVAQVRSRSDLACQDELSIKDTTRFIVDWMKSNVN